MALEDGDLRSHILALPTWADLKGFMTRIEKAFRKDIEDLQADTAHTRGRVEALEASVEDNYPTLQALQTRCMEQDQSIDSLLDQLDDAENRSRRVNICIRGGNRKLETLSLPFRGFSRRSWVKRHLTT